jgi:hypothetical protein
LNVANNVLVSPVQPSLVDLEAVSVDLLWPSLLTNGVDLDPFLLDHLPEPLRRELSLRTDLKDPMLVRLPRLIGIGVPLEAANSPRMPMLQLPLDANLGLASVEPDQKEDLVEPGMELPENSVTGVPLGLLLWLKPRMIGGPTELLDLLLLHPRLP